MVTDKTSKTVPTFTIENNVLKGVSTPRVYRYTSVGQLLFDCLMENSACVGQVDVVTEVEETFGDIAERAIKCALWMQKQGVTSGDIIAVSSHNHLDSFTPCLAALFIGASFNPWDCEMNTQLARHLMTLSQPKVIFANEKSVGVAIEASKIEVFHTKFVCFGDYPGAVPFSEVMSGHSESAVAHFRCTEIGDPEQTATLLYSSGTTGLPKCVQLTHRGLLYALESFGAIDMKANLPLWFSSLYWISGTLLSMKSIRAGTKRLVTPNYTAKIACEIIEKYKVSWMMLSTSMANRFARYNGLHNYDLSSVVFILVGGAAMKGDSQDLLRKQLPKTLIIQAYGMTELGGVVTVQLPDSTSGSCGVVSADCEIKIIEPKVGRALGPNQSGELWAKSPAISTGYYKNPEATKDVIDEDGWVHSGDLAYYNEKGEIFIVDRLKEIIKYRGQQITPSLIEDLLQTHPAVLEVSVVSIPHLTDDEHPVAFVSKVHNREVTEQELVNMVASNLMDHYKLRGGVKFLPSLPHTPSGKISRKELKAIAKTLAVS
ncbi:uncharacterized protein LOC143369328 [Andrena cerasifolii]|uniref:uncharacterized protein LOC143369328 n=1 Tax=Andrena cerasifolii TaxID=2819439 RepID=UPI004037AADC